MLAPAARLIDHVLQPLAQSYTDYVQNSTSLILHLQDFIIPSNALLVTIDVIGLYPSIPQDECLRIVCEEMHSHRELVLFDPNLIIKLLHISINSNYFNFANLTFHQIQGTAMGASFSPTIANIFMSVLLRKFFSTQPNQPILLKRYIDDIFMIWPANLDVHNFMGTLNNHHPTVKFTYNCSLTSVEFLDLTVYKSHTHLATKTYSKSIPVSLLQLVSSQICTQRTYNRRMHSICKNKHRESKLRSNSKVIHSTSPEETISDTIYHQIYQQSTSVEDSNTCEAPNQIDTSSSQSSNAYHHPNTSNSET